MALDHLGPLLGVTVLAGLVCGITGFGFGLVAMGLLATVIPVQEATVIVSMASLLIALLNVWTVRHALRWREVLPLLVTALPLATLGVYLLTHLDTSILQAGVAGTILLGCAAALWSPRRALIPRALPWAPAFGAVSGLFQGALGTGGPPVVIYALLRGWDKDVSKSTIAMYFALSNLWRLILMTTTGVATPTMLRTGSMLLLPALLASYVGTRIFARMSNPIFRYATMALLVGVAAQLVLS